MIRMPARTALAALMLMTALAALLQGCSAAPSPAPSPVGSAPQGADRFAGAPEGTAAVEGPVQRIAVDVSRGYFDPTIINAKAGVPLEIAFGQGQGCLARVEFPDLGVDRDLTSGGATVSLPALKPGEYVFSCGMQMVYGKLVVR